MSAPVKSEKRVVVPLWRWQVRRRGGAIVIGMLAGLVGCIAPDVASPDHQQSSAPRIEPRLEILNSHIRELNQRFETLTQTIHTESSSVMNNPWPYVFIVVAVLGLVAAMVWWIVRRENSQQCETIVGRLFDGRVDE